MAAPLRYRRRTRTALTAVVSALAVCAAISSCAAAPTVDTAAAPAPVPPAESVAPTPVIDPRTTAYEQALLDGGLPAVVPASTLRALLDATCRHLAGGTPEPAILEQLRPIAGYAASLSGGRLTGEAAAQLMLRAARTDLC
ncbi:hypothetical protein ERC79_01175 [Rhodococcus sp. ABRD24]|uniref:hypothetical protein n=1 Tax=Rhodococcus sp. ABRD24 TaxID=2507582 RepID=UPI00103FA374|nr:hypothetical protein [Rhodococcus sp. ABRD24]QBJ94730.1 hypothetical protein ERC79_01175 [Rhodococcus sp. ABRD24]